ncbi:DNA-binding transcriptional ArsR family regulator [Pullulanibacillus pueri]|uniref:HTH arsR-type domain-containing protein n=1 Tax=Pullulanibacillus pueri TaxID=1437324 RepID=A0A8J2ZZP9_9BACL|nr:metalloregulator ArsR/SmtB family transcription factor [Pullulanibacillus pueri]MBM7684164.1 DNA-binding transcriptional ArsR family regulator [Pullulanibacillus pueri]GGH88850.1 hypothetical protein GCM10007096_42120 [Pullulanibacillus pueri]
MPQIKHMHYLSSPVFELLAAGFRMCSHESMIGTRKPEGLDQWVRQKRATLSETMQADLDLFFNSESFFGLTLIRMAWDYKVYHQVKAFIEKLTTLPATTLFSYFFRTGYPSEQDYNIQNFESVNAYIEASTLPEKEKWKLTYLFLHKEQTKQKCIELLSTLHSLLEDEWEDLLRQHEASIQEVKALGSEVMELFSLPLSSIESVKEVVFAPSVFYWDCSLSSDSKDSLIYLYGIKLLNVQTEKKEKVLDALKILSDERRVEIIRLLNQGPLYGYELAKKMDLSNSTVSHHLSSLASIGLVKSVRRENRVYFEVQKQEVEELLERIKKFLLIK